MEDQNKESYSSLGTVKDLSNMYGNVETFKYPDDIQNGNLLNSVLDKVLAFQTASYYAEKNFEALRRN